MVGSREDEQKGKKFIKVGYYFKISNTYDIINTCIK